jgi:hypothetical protein
MRSNDVDWKGEYLKWNGLKVIKLDVLLEESDEEFEPFESVSSAVETYPGTIRARLVRANTDFFAVKFCFFAFTILVKSRVFGCLNKILFRPKIFCFLNRRIPRFSSHKTNKDDPLERHEEIGAYRSHQEANNCWENSRHRPKERSLDPNHGRV